MHSFKSIYDVTMFAIIKSITKTVRQKATLKLWSEGYIGEIVQKVRTIQKSALSFAELTWEGKVSAALKMLSKEFDNGDLKLNKKVLEELKLKHPALVEVKEDSLLKWLINKVPNSYFNDTMKSASFIKGSDGPSHVDSDHFCHMGAVQ